MPDVSTWQAIAGVLVIAVIVGFGFSVGAWAWGKLCTALKI